MACGPIYFISLPIFPSPRENSRLYVLCISHPELDSLTSSERYYSSEQEDKKKLAPAPSSSPKFRSPLQPLPSLLYYSPAKSQLSRAMKLLDIREN